MYAIYMHYIYVPYNILIYSISSCLQVKPSTIDMVLSGWGFIYNNILRRKYLKHAEVQVNKYLKALRSRFRLLKGFKRAFKGAPRGVRRLSKATNALFSLAVCRQLHGLHRATKADGGHAVRESESRPLLVII